MEAIQLRKTSIEIPFVDEKGNVTLTLHFDKSDDSINRLFSMSDELEKLSKKLEKNASLDDAKEFVKITYDKLFGEGTFEKVYELSHSTINSVIYLLQISQGIQDELEQEEIQNLAKKYKK